jgi:hypothetical protein
MERTKFTPFARLFSGESNMMDKISVFFGPVDSEGGFNKLYEGVLEPFTVIFVLCFPMLSYRVVFVISYSFITVQHTNCFALHAATNLIFT